MTSGTPSPQPSASEGRGSGPGGRPSSSQFSRSEGRGSRAEGRGRAAQGSSQQVLRRLAAYALPHWRLATATLFVTLLATGAELAIPRLLQDR